MNGPGVDGAGLPRSAGVLLHGQLGLRDRPEQAHREHADPDEHHAEPRADDGACEAIAESHDADFLMLGFFENDRAHHRDDEEDSEREQHAAEDAQQPIRPRP